MAIDFFAEYVVGIFVIGVIVLMLLRPVVSAARNWPAQKPKPEYEFMLAIGRVLSLVPSIVVVYFIWLLIIQPLIEPVYAAGCGSDRPGDCFENWFFLPFYLIVSGILWLLGRSLIKRSLVVDQNQAQPPTSSSDTSGQQ